MNRSAWMLCKSFLMECDSEKQHALFAHLSEGLQLFLQQLPEASLPKEGKISSLKGVLDLIHFSWFAPFLRSLSENDIRLFLSILNADQIAGLKRHLRFTDHLPHPTSLGLQFLRDLLLQRLLEENEELLPMECLPPNPLNSLAEMPHATLMVFIHFFGLHDLAYEMRQIIDTVRLKRIFQSLSANSQEYLNFLLTQKEPLLFQRMSLQNWDGKPQSLNAQIEKSGIFRLGKVLYDQDPSLLWYVTHHLEMAIASQMQQHCTPTPSDKAKQSLMDQAIKILSLMNIKAG